MPPSSSAESPDAPEEETSADEELGRELFELAETDDDETPTTLTVTDADAEPSELAVRPDEELPNCESAHPARIANTITEAHNDAITVTRIRFTTFS